MLIELIYLHVLGQSDPLAPPPSYYWAFMQRFAETYAAFDPGLNHQLVVVCCGPEGSRMDATDLYPRGTQFMWYGGKGWDCGAHLWAARKSQADWVICLSTPVYFWKEGWLKCLAEVWGKYGDGLYGPQGSYEHAQHIRTSFYAFKPERARQFPHTVETREHCRFFETTDWNFTTWFARQKLPVRMVTWDGDYGLDEFRKPANIFRRGDQSNLLALDRHNDIYRNAPPEEKAHLEAAADGK